MGCNDLYSGDVARVIIDAHVHLFPERIRNNPQSVASVDPWFAQCHSRGEVLASETMLIEAMDAAHIDRAICFTWPFADPALCAEGNDYMANVVRQFPDRIMGFGIVQPNAPGADDEVLRCARLGLRGIGELNSDAQGWAIEDAGVAAVAKASVEADLPWTLHCSEPVGYDYRGKGTMTPDRVVRLVEQFPDLKVICAHLGGGLALYGHMSSLEKVRDRLWFDTAAAPFVYEPSVFRSVIDACGPERILFGSDFPLIGPGRYLDAFEGAGLTDEERGFVLGDAAATLLNL